jgi:Bacterial tandem repeat domain 1
VIDAQEYQAVSNKLVGQGYRLVFVSAFGSGNAAKYCAICRKDDGPD